VSPRKSTSTLETPIRSSSSQRRKPKADLYTALLALALVALLVAVLFLYLYMGVFEFKIKGAPTAAAFGGVQTQLAHCHSGPIHDIVF
jgi:hypothetical protein